MTIMSDKRQRLLGRIEFVEVLANQKHMNSIKIFI
ncbi:MAG: hypothetical protein ACI89T_002198 [Cognaticolwellia sp.]|jgi:hypothetical protein